MLEIYNLKNYSSENTYEEGLKLSRLLIIMRNTSGDIYIKFMNSITYLELLFLLFIKNYVFYF